MKPLLCLSLIFLSACSSVVPSAVARLYQLTPLEADPADLAVALELPDGVQVRPGTAKIIFDARRTDIGETSKETYDLRTQTDLTSGLTVLAVDPDDYDALRAQQGLISDWEAANDEATEGSISVGFEGCKTGPGPAEDAMVSVLIRTERDGRFFALVKDATLAEVLQVLDLSEVKPC